VSTYNGTTFWGFDKAPKLLRERSIITLTIISQRFCVSIICY